MNLFNGNCNNGRGLFNGDDTILWFIILFLLIFSNNGCCNNVAGDRYNGYSDDCGCGC